MVITLTPTAVGTVGVVAGDFGLELAPQGGTTTHDLYTCTAPESGSRASVALTIVSSAGTSPSATPSDDGTDDGGGDSPAPTETVTETTTASATTTVTSTVSSTATVTHRTTAQISRTPLGGAQTGGGGEIGPDGRIFVLAGAVLMAASASGGLMLRRSGSRTSARGVRHV
ncbi:hypothetical protein [Microbispora sp. ATCC PTA-5024]|uniref:hypothetical protein n=1 Tax=Microbispora sp. ATCC PTA-5024 TaxID=316330 RepID=UPI0012EDD170|nr:hypothetical protein [Microbispora sp. ATCC PTA-5024]